jgi:putative endopeptidase
MNSKHLVSKLFNRSVYSVVLAGLIACSAAPEKPLRSSSRIPERREFPVNPAIAPCQDFYEYACSAVIKGFELPADRSVYTFAFHDSAERILEAKKQFLSGLVKSGGETARQTALNNFYQACMNQQAAAAEERENVARILAEINSIRTHAEFQDYIQRQIDQGAYSLIGFATLPSLTDSDRLDVLFGPKVTSLPEQSFYSRPEILADLAGLIEAVFTAVVLDRPKQRADWVVEFEKRIKLSEPTPVKLRELRTSPTIVARDRFLADYPALGMDRVVQRIPRDTGIRHWFPETFELLNGALESEPLENLKSLYLYHELSRYMDDAYPDIFQLHFDFRKKYLGGPDVRPDRQERCTREVMNNLGRELDAELLPLLFPDFPEQDIITLAERVRGELLRSIESNAWISDAARRVALEKLAAAKLYLVKPHSEQEWDFSPVLEYSDKAPYQNGLRLAKALKDKMIGELYAPRNREKWASPPLTVNAYFSPSDNKFVLFQGILQYPFFDPEASETVNLGSGGMIIAHELGHAIDDQGSRFDASGNTVAWMSENDLQHFHARGNGLVEQFDRAGYNGKLELGENIADLVGLSVAYRTAFPGNNGDLAEKQNFFLQYARNWCTVMRPSALELQIKTNTHAPGKGRVNEQVKHQPGFQEAFACKAGDPMVLPADRRIKIW